MNGKVKICIKLLLKCILVLLPVWCFCVYSKLCLGSIVNEDSMGLFWNTEFTKQTQTKYYDTVILGDSIANSAYIPELLSDSTINLAIAGTGVVENYYTLENYLKYNNAPKDVFISMADYHLAQDSFTWSSCNYMHKLSLMQNLEIYKEILNNATEPMSEIASSSYWSDVIMYKLWMPSKYMVSIIGSLDEQRAESNKVYYDEITARIGRHCSISNEIYVPESDIGYTTFDVSKLQEQYYLKLIELCEKNNIKLHIVKLPTPANTFYSDEYIVRINDYYNNIMEGYTNVEFIWPIQIYEIESFKDSNHMNNHGAYQFSRKIKEIYPNVFCDNTISAARYAAIDQDIKTEYDLDYIYEWIKGFDYTVDIENTNYIVTNNYTNSVVDKGKFEVHEDGLRRILDKK